MTMNVNGVNPLSYGGVQATTPPQLLYMHRDPTTNDSKNVIIGTFWIYSNYPASPKVYKLWQLVDLTGGVATWIQLYPVNAGDLKFITDSGTAAPVAGIINFKEAAAGQGTATFVAPGSTNLVSVKFSDTGSNIGLGSLSLINNVPATGKFNSAYGSGSLSTNSTASSSSAFGYDALFASNAQNDAFGYGSQAATTSGAGNCSFGNQSLNAITTSSNSTAMGYQSQAIATTGPNDSFGAASLQSLTGGGTKNVAIGYESLQNLVTGSNCISIGYQSSSAYVGSESNNIVIGAPGTASESGVIRIGKSGTHTSAFVQGINGVNVGSTANVATVATSGQLGTATITAGSGITITPSANTITISSSGSGGGESSFSVYLTASETGLGNSDFNTVAWNAALFDTLSNVNLTTGVFTAPVSGKYAFNYAIFYNKTTGSNQAISGFYLTNGSSINNLYQGGFFANSAAQTGLLQGSIIINMLANQKMSVWTTGANAGGGVHTDYISSTVSSVSGSAPAANVLASYFCGYFVSA